MPTILVIDASASVRETLRIVLRQEYDVALVPSLDVAAPEAPPALVILGLPLPARDDRSTGAALATFGSDVPLLLLNTPADVDVRELVSPGRRVDFLPKPFDAYALRARVRALLTEASAPLVDPAQADHYRRHLEYPFLPRAAAFIARQALSTDMPVLLTGECGAGAPEVAYAIHFFSGRSGPFAVVRADQLRAGDLQRLLPATSPEGHDGGTLYVEAIHQAPPATHHDLLGLVKGHVAPGAIAPVRVLASTSEDLVRHASAGRILPELAYALSTLPLALPPLRERLDDIPALVEALTADLTTRLRLGPIAYTDAALQCLTQYQWFGNVAELEAVLGRTLALHRPRLVEPGHLVFFPEEAATAVAAGMPRRESRGVMAPPPPATPNLEILLGELAHELRNPMVTIKTFAQHLDSVMNDPEVRARFSSLTVDAVDRMDSLLETLLDFGRFRLPAPQPLDIRELFERALAECEEELTRKGVQVERDGVDPGAGRVRADESQVLFALRRLLAGLIRDLVPHQPLRVTTLAGGGIEIHVHMEPTTSERLAAWVDEEPGPATGETPPLSFTLAATLLQRNAGSLKVRGAGGGATVITLAWSGSAEER